MTYGLTPQGFNAERLDQIVNDLNDAFIAQFGDINTSPQSVFGQIIGVFAKSYADLWENMNDVYLSQYPNSAFGVSLDNVVALNGITRLAATQTQVYGSCSGNEGTFISPNALARIPDTNELFFAIDGGNITSGSLDNVTVSVTALAAQIYTILLNSVPYIFSLPNIAFTGSFVTSNSTVVTINGISLTAVPYNTSSSQTITDIASMIATDAAVYSATKVGSQINIIPNPGYSVTVNYVTITGGASQPTWAIGFNVPSTLDQVSAALVSVINANSPPWTATDSSGTFSMVTNDESIPFSLGVGTNLEITSIASPILFYSQNFGPISCTQNALTQIVTPISGWNTITNPEAGIPGINAETDAQLRVRRYNSIKLLGLGTVEAITAQLINVPNVVGTSVQVIENTSLTEDDMVITFSGAVTSGQTINVTYNDGGGSFAVPFDTSQAQTMTDLANAFLATPQVATAVVSGSSLVLTLTFNVLQEIAMTTGDVTVTGSGTLPTATVLGGQPAKSIQAILLGGTNAAIGEAIWLSKPAGIETFGTDEVTIVDSQGNNQVIFFSRPTEIYIWVNATLTLYAEENFPPNGLGLVQQAIVNYINSLGVGADVLRQRVQNQVFSIPGISHVDMQIAFTITPSASPSFSYSDITLASTQIATTSLELVTVID